jgi:hypothetical protein
METRKPKLALPISNTWYASSLSEACGLLSRTRAGSHSHATTHTRAGGHARTRPTTISSGITGAYGKQKRRQLIRERKKESSSPTQPNPSSPGPSHAITLGEKQRADGSCMRQSKKKKKNSPVQPFNPALKTKKEMLPALTPRRPHWHAPYSSSSVSAQVDLDRSS